MSCYKCKQEGLFPKLKCNCNICKTCIYDFCCPNCRRELSDFGEGFFVLDFFFSDEEVEEEDLEDLERKEGIKTKKSIKIKEGIKVEKFLMDNIYLSSLTDRNITIKTKIIIDDYIFIPYDELIKLEIKYLCVRNKDTDYLSIYLLDIEDLRLFEINPDKTIHYMSQLVKTSSCDYFDVFPDLLPLFRY